MKRISWPFGQQCAIVEWGRYKETKTPEKYWRPMAAKSSVEKLQIGSLEIYGFGSKAVLKKPWQTTLKSSLRNADLSGQNSLILQHAGGPFHTTPQKFKNVFFTLKTHEIWKRNNHRSFWICVWRKLGQGNHVIIVTSSFTKSPSTLTQKADVFKFLPDWRVFSKSYVFVTD